MSQKIKFNELVNTLPESKFVLQGNEAFALGVVHAGYHAADGYPGTPSTEVIDKCLAHVQDKIKVGWSVNEAVAVGVAVGHSIAGYDSVVTMKIPGVFQAADPISTSAFYTSESGALVIYAATDYLPSSTQHIIDPRYFFASLRVPILEPKNHQEMYEMAWHAQDISKKFNTTVVLLASGVLAHSDGLVVTKEPRIVKPRNLPENLRNWMLMPNIARNNYQVATKQRIPSIGKWVEDSTLFQETKGTDSYGIITSGESHMIIKEALYSIKADPSIFALSVTNPLPREKIKKFAQRINGKIFVFEDGDTFLEERLRLDKIDVIGKNELSGITEWQPDSVLKFLSQYININYKQKKIQLDIQPIKRPPSICPGCPYRAFALVVDKLKKKGKIYGVFGEIGCSTLLYFLNGIDTVICMGGAEPMRQGFVLSRPQMASKTLSVIGDSCECHSGLDGTRNAVFRNIPGVKIILDNRATAMTGGQPAPTSKTNLAGIENKFVLKDALEAEKCRTIVADSYDLKGIEKIITEALLLAEQGEFTAVILEGACVLEASVKKRLRKTSINYGKCRQCGLCNVCSGIELDEENNPRYTNNCTNCGSNLHVCKQRCPFDAISAVEELEESRKEQIISQNLLCKEENTVDLDIQREWLPESLRVAIRGIGGQGNLFFGKILSEIALKTPYTHEHIVKGDTHGMAQKGGAVISTFSCGKVFSPIFVSASVDVLVVMEISEVLRPGFLELLKPNGKIIFNTYTAVPGNCKNKDYPDLNKIEEYLKNYQIIKIDANKIAYQSGDKTGKSANVVILGVLSTIEPFNKIPEELWSSVIVKNSSTVLLQSINRKAFIKGRNYRDT